MGKKENVRFKERVRERKEWGSAYPFIVIGWDGWDGKTINSSVKELDPSLPPPKKVE
jgi:hypothetical protein